MNDLNIFDNYKSHFERVFSPLVKPIYSQHKKLFSHEIPTEMLLNHSNHFYLNDGLLGLLVTANHIKKHQSENNHATFYLPISVAHFTPIEILRNCIFYQSPSFLKSETFNTLVSHFLLPQPCFEADKIILLIKQFEEKVENIFFTYSNLDIDEVRYSFRQYLRPDDMINFIFQLRNAYPNKNIQMISYNEFKDLNFKKSIYLDSNFSNFYFSNNSLVETAEIMGAQVIKPKNAQTSFSLKICQENEILHPIQNYKYYRPNNLINSLYTAYDLNILGNFFPSDLNINIRNDFFFPESMYNFALYIYKKYESNIKH